MPKYPGGYDAACSVSRSLRHIGERWTFLIIRDAFYGVRRFDDFQANLGIARNILTKRLASLVDAGIMRRSQYQERPSRFEYRLTEKGRDLAPVLTTILAWGDKWESAEPPVQLIHTECGNAMHAETVCSECSQPLTAFNLTIAPPPRVLRDVEERSTFA